MIYERSSWWISLDHHDGLQLVSVGFRFKIVFRGFYEKRCVILGRMANVDIVSGFGSEHVISV